jgi:adenylate cyclase class 2
MTNDVNEVEYKVLNVDIAQVDTVMRRIGATKVYDDVRTITYFDTTDRALATAKEGIKLTEEDKLKLEHTRKGADGRSDTVKLFVSRKKEAAEFLSRLKLAPITEVKARRISYELGPTDFDIDMFPGIPPFMEVDLGDPGLELAGMLAQLALADKEVIMASTPEIFRRYGKDYFAEFAL